MLLTACYSLCWDSRYLSSLRPLRRARVPRSRRARHRVCTPRSCVYASLVCFGVPIVIALLPIIALTSFGKMARRFLWGYSPFIALLFFPIGTAVGVHTLYLLRSTTVAGSSIVD